MINASKTKAVGMIFLAVGFIYILFLINSTVFSKKNAEKFQVEKDKESVFEKPPGSVDGTDQYKSRLYVIKVFDAMFNRKPSADELAKYGSFGVDKDIMTAILNDYDVLEKSNTDGDTLEAQTAVTKKTMGYDRYENVHAEVENEAGHEDGLAPSTASSLKTATAPTAAATTSIPTAAKALPSSTGKANVHEVIANLEAGIAELKLLLGK